MTVAADRQFTLQFDGALTMTHHATNLDLPGEANITTAAGDVATFQSTGSNTVQCIAYTKADGTGVAGGGDFANGGDVGGANRSIGNTDAFDISIETNNVAQLTIEGSATGTGILTTPNQSGCSVTLSGNQTIATGTITKLVLATEIYDIQNEFDSVTNNRFTATLAGKYLVISNVQIGALANAVVFNPLIHVNGALTTKAAFAPGIASDAHAVISTVLDLDAADYVETFTYHEHGSNRTAEAGGTRNTMMVQKIA
jgi:hypothetical protein